MRLDQRLRLLRGEGAQAAPDPQQGDLSQRLRRVFAGTRRRAPVGRPDEQALAQTLGAERLAPGVLRVEQRFAPGSCPPRGMLENCRSALPALIDGPAGHPDGWRFLDTETSGLAGGTGTWAFLCGLARFDGDGLLLRQYLLSRLDAEPAYLEAVGAELGTARLLVTYNGKSFDVPLLATRLRLAGLPAPFGGQRHLDLLCPVRRAFRGVWPNCRLVTAEARLLGLARDGDLPGAEAPAAWRDWLRRGEIERLAGVLRHNRWDLLSLPALVPPLQQSFFDPAVTGADAHAVARFHLSGGNADLAFQLLLSNRHRLSPPGLLDLARLHCRRGDWPAARRIWGDLAEQGEARAMEAQAKYLEHRERDFAGALEWVHRLPAGPGREYRRRRLEGKLRVQGARPGSTSN